MMTAETAVDICRDTLISAVIVGAPMLIVGMLAGLVIGLIQALTQVQDQTVSFVPKILAMAAVIAACFPWLVEKLVDITRIAFINAGKL